MLNRMYRNICKHYGVYSFVANFLIAVSTGGMMVLGVITDYLTVAWLLGWAAIFFLMFWVGKLLDQEIDDIDKVIAHEDISDPAKREACGNCTNSCSCVVRE